MKQAFLAQFDKQPEFTIPTATASLQELWISPSKTKTAQGSRYKAC